MRIVCFSDVHGHSDKIQLPEADVIIFTGDMINTMNHRIFGEKLCKEFALNDIKKLQDLFNQSSASYKLFIPGNHDFEFQDRPNEELIIGRNIYNLHEKSIIIDGVKFSGQSFQPYFYNLKELLIC